MSFGKQINLKCEICGKELTSTKSMSHIPLIHKITIKQYFDKYLRKTNEGFCLECGNETKFLGIFLRYQKFCSLKCSNTNTTRKQKFSKSYKENDIEIIKEKRYNTNFIRYGNRNANQVREIKKKIVETCLRKYNVPNPMMRKEISDKSQSNRKVPFTSASYKWKKYLTPSGKVLLVQGKENKLLDKLLKIFPENEISVHKGVPTIKYIDCNGKVRKHFPDVYIKKLNWIFECKCNYTWNPNEVDRKNNILKYKEAKKLGFKYNIMIF